MILIRILEGKISFTCNLTLSLKVFIIKRTEIWLDFNYMYSANDY